MRKKTLHAASGKDTLIFHLETKFKYPNKNQLFITKRTIFYLQSSRATSSFISERWINRQCTHTATRWQPIKHCRATRFVRRSCKRPFVVYIVHQRRSDIISSRARRIVEGRDRELLVFIHARRARIISIYMCASAQRARMDVISADTYIYYTDRDAAAGALMLLLLCRK